MADLSRNSFKRRAKLHGKADAEMAEARAFVAKRLSAISNTKPVTCPPEAAAIIGKHERAPRQSVYRLASLYISKIDCVRCVVVNLSADGARITMEGIFELPEFVVLRFDQSGVKRKARIAWRQDRDIGLTFIKEERDDDQD